MTTITIEKKIKETIEVPEYFTEAGGFRHCRLLSPYRFLSVGKGIIVELSVDCLASEIVPCTQEDFENAFNESLNNFTQYATNQNS
jgi:hypothetical protein